MIQIDIDMPESCNDCPFQGETYHGCPLVAGVLEWQVEIAEKCRDKRSEHCPLKEQEKWDEPTPVVYTKNIFTFLPVAHCPQCGKFLEQFHVGEEKETKFCPWCGQEVKWE